MIKRDNQHRRAKLKNYILSIILSALVFLAAGYAMISTIQSITIHDIQKTEFLIRNIKIIGIAALILVYLLFVATLNATYKRNKILFEYAYNDPLTDLPNKRSFEEYIQSEMNSRNQKKLAVYMINCINFKFINLTFGYHYGDNVIKKCAANLLKTSSNDCKLFHLGADQFIICLKNYSTQSDLVDLSDTIIKIMEATITSKSIRIAVGVVELNDKRYDADRS